MKLTRATSRIVGLQVGEISVYLLGAPQGIRAKMALIASGGPEGAGITTVGSIDMSTGWSEETIELLRKLAESMEKDALPSLFQEEQIEKSDTVGQESSEPEEPPQI